MEGDIDSSQEHNKEGKISHDGGSTICRREGKGFPKEPRCFKHQEVSKAGKIWLLLTMEFNEGEFLIKRAPSTRVGKIRQDCEDRVGWADKGSRHSDFIQMIIHWLGQQLHKSGNLNNRHFNSVWQHQGPF